MDIETFRPRLRVLNREQTRAIHKAALEILDKPGFKMEHPGALEMLSGAGCRVSKDNWVNIEKFSQFQFEEDVLVFDAMNMKPRLIGSKNATRPIILMELSNVNGDEVRLNDFDSAGEKGQYYITWLKVNNISKAPFSHSNPLRSGRVGR